jgi:3D (Asp-Asp-Asp) domain-containing protein
LEKQETKEEFLRIIRRVVLAALSIVLSCIVCLGANKQLAEATYEKPKAPNSAPAKEAERGVEKVIRTMRVKVTAYYGPVPGQKEYVLGSYKKDVRMNGAGVETRSGTFPEIGTAAADWRILKKGTKFRIRKCNGTLGASTPKPVNEIIFTVEDTGGAIKGRHVDIFTGHGDLGRRLAENFDSGSYTIEVVKYLPQ